MRRLHNAKRHYGGGIASFLTLIASYAVLLFPSPTWAASSSTTSAEAPYGHVSKHAAHADAHGHDAAAGGETINWFSFDYGPGKAHANPPFFWMLVNFAILLFLLAKFAMPAIGRYLRQRSAQVRTDLDAAAALRREAEGQLDTITKKLHQLDKEIAEIKTSVAVDAEREKAQIVENAEEEAKRIVENAERTVQQEIERVKRTLEVTAIQAAMDAAEKILTDRVTEDDHIRLRNEYISTLGESKAAGGAN